MLYLNSNGDDLALTAKEQRLIEALVDSQLRLERIVGSALGGPMGGIGVRLAQQDIFDSPFLMDRQERIDTGRKVGRVAKRTGQKTRRKVSGYQKEFGKQFKKLKKMHPRTKPSILMKKAHRATKKVRR